MSLLNIKILGYEINDALLFKFILGGIFSTVLILIIGVDSFSTWVSKSLVIWISVTMIVLPLTFGFLDEEFTHKHFTMLTAGLVLLIVFGYYSQLPFNDLAVNTIQSLIWMTLFSIILDFIKTRSQKLFNSNKSSM